jgi:hypothetical protein
VRKSRSVSFEFPRFPMFPDFIVANDEFLTESRSGCDQWLAVKQAEYQLMLFVAAIDAYPHPLSGKRVFALEFHFYEITVLVGSHLTLRLDIFYA